MNQRERDNIDRHIVGNSNDTDGEWHTCAHCDGTGKQQGPGGWEECFHCRGTGEIWLEDGDTDNE